MHVPNRWITFVLCAAAVAGCSRTARDPHEARAPLVGVPDARLVRDIWLGSAPAGSTPHGFVVSGSSVFFVADDGASGQELWRTDGTGSGTSLVLDLRPGGASSLPAAPVLPSDARFQAVPFTDPLPPHRAGVLFPADDGARGTELWFSDGTASGTRLVRDLERGSRSSSPHALTVVGSTTFFVATTSANGPDLWKTNGTTAGTQRVATAPTAQGLAPEGLAALGDLLYFVAPDPGVGARVLWQSDGSQGGTTPVAASAAVDPCSLTPFGDHLLYFTASETAGGAVQLWVLDQRAGTVGVVGDAATNPTDPALLTPVLSGPQAPRLFYAATRGGQVDLFSTDGAAQTRHTADGVAPAAIATAGGNVFVSATRPATGRELYAWTGSALVNLVDAAVPGDSNPSSLTDVAGTLVFSATVAGAPSLFRSDGQPGAGHTYAVLGAGRAVGEIVALPAGAFPAPALLAAADDAAGMELWQTDGGADGTSMVANLRPDVGSSSPRGLAAWNGRLLFSADDGLDGRELWSWSTSTGATLLSDLDLNPSSSEPDELVALGTTVLFAATDLLVSGRELWATDGTAAGTRLLANLAPGTADSRPAHLVALGGGVLFTADDASRGRELWRADGTPAGTSLVKDLWPGGSSSPRSLTVAGPYVWFAADDGATGGTKPFRTDGTAAGTAAVDLLNCGGGVTVSAPEWFAELDGTAVFSAFEPNNYGRELFRWNPGSGCTNLVKDLASGFDADFNPLSSNPVAFTVHQGLGYFGARDTDAGYALWRTDGFGATTTKVAPVATAGGGSIASPASVPNVGQPPRQLLFFVANDELHGAEPWVSDGTAAGTHLVVDANPGPLGSADGSVFLPLPARGHVLYAANDGVSGRELWISDGTALGTRMLQDLRPGPASSNPEGLAAVGDLVFFTADDGATGRELWVLDTSVAALDLTPPVPSCPASVAVEATSPAGADPTFAITASDEPGGGPASVTYQPAPGSHLPFGDTAVTATATDAAGNRAQCTFVASVDDRTAPALTCPASFQVEAASAAGADASYAATATDAVTPTPTVAYAPAPGSRFPLGPQKAPLATPVTVTATDARGNASTCSFSVTVADTTPPGVTCPFVPAVQAISPAGAPASWGDVAASDAVTAAGSIAIAFDATPGATFPLGLTVVHATATDEAGNVGRCGVEIHVVDTLAPVITCPAVDPSEATTTAGAAVTFAASASDLATASPAIGYDLPAGSTFPLGTTTVTATATDGSGNQARCSFPVTVRDTTPPILSCPGPLVLAEAQEAAGALVSYDAIAVDLATPTPLLAYAPASGSRFGLDQPTLVTATATDDRGNSAQCAFTVQVQDTTPPALTACSTEVFYEATSATTTMVAHPRDFAHDLVTADPELAFSFSQPDLEERPLGSIPVSATAADHASNTSATCTFLSTVRDTTPPVPTCPADVFVEAASAAGAVAWWPDATGDDLVTPASSISPVYGLVSYDAVQGGLFPLAPGAPSTATTVTATVRDELANGATCQFHVVVRDTTAPAVTCPGAMTVEATSPGGAAVTFDATATDAVWPLLPVPSYAPARGGTFPLGTTLVTASAADAAGNVSSCTFPVTVVDTTAPALSCPSRTAEATGPDGGAVTFAIVATDEVTTAPAIDSSAASGDVFPLGSTTVSASATDGAGNHASCTFTVAVQDSTPPALVCPPNRTLQALGPTAVDLGAPGVSDAVTAAPVVISTAHSGDVFQNRHHPGDLQRDRRRRERVPVHDDRHGDEAGGAGVVRVRERERGDDRAPRPARAPAAPARCARARGLEWRGLQRPLKGLTGSGSESRGSGPPGGGDRGPAARFHPSWAILDRSRAEQPPAPRPAAASGIHPRPPPVSARPDSGLIPRGLGIRPNYDCLAIARYSVAKGATPWRPPTRAAPRSSTATT